MFLAIQFLSAKKIVGMQRTMSIANNRTFELWRSFMPRRKEINNALGNDLLSMQIFPVDFNFQNFNIHENFEKWAAVEVTHWNHIPKGMQTFNLPEGNYAVFLYKGHPEKGEAAFRYIFEEWIPASGYVIDARPHFEILGAKYKNGDEQSEEEIWIPLRLK